MLKLLIRGALTLVSLAVLWLFTARWLSMAVDEVWRAPIVTLPASPVGWNGSELQFGPEPPATAGDTANWNGRAGAGASSHPLSLEGSGPAYAPVASADGGEALTLSAHGRHFLLGRRAGTISDGDGQVPAYAALPGDVATLRLEHSALAWPVFEPNFVTGASPTWRRDLYFHLTWTQPSGARLDMVWRYEQGFYKFDGWLAPGDRDHVTGLIKVDIRP